MVFGILSYSWPHHQIAVIFIALTIAYYQVVRSGLIPAVLSIANLSRLVLLLAIALGLVARPRVAVGLLVMAAYFLSFY